MSERLPTHLIVSALLRRVNDAGGMAMVRASGNRMAGAVLVLIGGRAIERGISPDGRAMLIEARAASAIEPLDDYWRRRRARDPDLWVIELDIAGAESIAAEVLL